MTTREQLEAEAEAMYPTPADPYTPHEAFHERAAHVRAKSVTAEQWGLAAGRVQDNWNLCGDDAGCHCEDATEFAWEVARDAFRAAGFYVLEDTDEHP